MNSRNRPNIQVVSHGLGCLDGAVAAAVVSHFNPQSRITPIFVTNNDTDRALQELKLAPGVQNEIWITDLSWRCEATAVHLNQLAAAGARIYWIDHHRSALSRANAPEFRVEFAGKVLSEEFSAARLAYDYLRQHRAVAGTGESEAEFFRIVELADDHDRWVHRLPESARWALAVQALGAHDSYRSIIRLKRATLSAKLAAAAKAGETAMRLSLERARATLVEQPLPGGLTLLSACCVGFSSEVAFELYRTRRQTVVALFDLRTAGVSLRRSEDCTVDLSQLASSFGGGGHAAAAGFRMAELCRAPAERLALQLSEKIAVGNP
jgi:oligoribonuclease NrnB/cAMP/cGMP phosphodiesterase (DHH superfamily)